MVTRLPAIQAIPLKNSWKTERPAQKQLLATLDILVDGEFVLAQRNLDLRFRGSENQRILDVPQSLAQGRAVWCTAARWVGERQA